MSRRNIHIRRGLEYNTGLENYVKYLTDLDTRPTKRMKGGTRGARRKFILRVLLPFGMTVTADTLVEVRVSEKSDTALATPIGARLKKDAADLAKGLTFNKFRPARVSVFEGNGNATYVPSKYTKLNYLKYEGDGYSLPFGALTATEEEQDGAKAVRAGVRTTFSASDIVRVSFSPEKVPG